MQETKNVTNRLQQRNMTNMKQRVFVDDSNLCRSLPHECPLPLPCSRTS